MYLEEFQKDLERALIELNMYGILAQLVEHLTFNQVVRGSNPRCLIKNASLKEAFFNVRHRRNRTPDNVVDRGARRPVDV